MDGFPYHHIRIVINECVVKIKRSEFNAGHLASDQLVDPVRFKRRE
jgi:hypothetical protein